MADRSVSAKSGEWEVAWPVDDTQPEIIKLSLSLNISPSLSTLFVIDILHFLWLTSLHLPPR